MIGIPEIETRPAQEVRAFQEAKLRQLMTYLAQHSPFYRRHFAKHAVDAGSIVSLADLARIPTVGKDDVQRENEDFFCVPRGRVAEYMSTSGTLGKPVTVPLTANDLDRLAYNESISFACAGTGRDDLFQLMLTLDRQFMAGIAYYNGIRRLGGSVVRVGPGVPAMQLDAIARLRPSVLVAVPSFLVRLIEHAGASGFDLAASSVRKVICIGEAIRNPDFSLSVVGQRIAGQWDVQLLSTYASTEMQTAFTECGAGRGGHHHPELIIVEILDESGNAVPPGAPGEVTVTTLGVEGMPLLRYRTGDICALHTGPCECGRTAARLGPVAGRKQHLIKLKGTTIYPQGLFDILHEVRGIDDYVVEVYTGSLGTDEVRLHLASEAREAVAAGLNAMFQSRLRVAPEVVFTTGEALEKMQGGAGVRKVRRFVDNRDVG